MVETSSYGMFDIFALFQLLTRALSAHALVSAVLSDRDWSARRPCFERCEK